MRQLRDDAYSEEHARLFGRERRTLAKVLKVRFRDPLVGVWLNNQSLLLDGDGSVRTIGDRGSEWDGGNMLQRGSGGKGVFRTWGGDIGFSVWLFCGL